MNIINSPANRTALVNLFLPQNGVVEGRMHYGPEDPSAQIPRATTVDSCNGNVGPNNALHARPTVLDVKTQHLNKNRREESFDNMDDSLPCTPEFQSNNEIDTISGSSAEDEVLENDTREFIIEFLKIHMGISKPRWHQNEVLSTMQRVVDELLEKHRYAYKGMIKKLSLDDNGDDVGYITVVAKHIFEDGNTNWGRIASLLAFGSTVCQYYMRNGRENCVEKVGQEISTYLLYYQRDWLTKNKGWTGFVEFFRVTDAETTVRNTLMAFAGIAGIGATLAMLIR